MAVLRGCMTTVISLLDYHMTIVMLFAIVTEGF